MGAKGRRVRILGKRMIINLNNTGGVRGFPHARASKTALFRSCMAKEKPSGTRTTVTGKTRKVYESAQVKKCWTA